MSESENSIKCGNIECKVAQTGTCVDGHDDPAACPLFGQEPSDDTDATSDQSTDLDASEPVEEDGPQLVNVARGEALNLRETAMLLSERQARIVSIVGPVDAGKTSLIACGFDLFQIAPMKGLDFVESRTLLGLERICHLSRASSEAPAVTGERTELDPDPFFFHLGVNDGSSRTDLLFADRSGELYEGVSDQPSRADDIIELSQCSVLTVLIDGEALCTPTRRHSVLSEARQFLSSLFGRGTLPREAQVVLVLSKVDEVEASDDPGAVRLSFETFVAETREAYSARVAQLHTVEIAASPKNAGTPRGHGVETLLRIWLSGVDVREHYSAQIISKPKRAVGRFEVHGGGA